MVGVNWTWKTLTWPAPITKTGEFPNLNFCQKNSKVRKVGSLTDYWDDAYAAGAEKIGGKFARKEKAVEPLFAAATAQLWREWGKGWGDDAMRQCDKPSPLHFKLSPDGSWLARCSCWRKLIPSSLPLVVLCSQIFNQNDESVVMSSSSLPVVDSIRCMQRQFNFKAENENARIIWNTIMWRQWLRHNSATN